MNYNKLNCINQHNFISFSLIPCSPQILRYLFAFLITKKNIDFKRQMLFTFLPNSYLFNWAYFF